MVCTTTIVPRYRECCICSKMTFKIGVPFNCQQQQQRRGCWRKPGSPIGQTTTEAEATTATSSSRGRGRQQQQKRWDRPELSAALAAEADEVSAPASGGGGRLHCSSAGPDCMCWSPPWVAVGMVGRRWSPPWQQRWARLDVLVASVGSGGHGVGGALLAPRSPGAVGGGLAPVPHHDRRRQPARAPPWRAQGLPVAASLRIRLFPSLHALTNTTRGGCLESSIFSS
ncbi:uncharacterized protein LOC123424876 isoform X2 [Hordeum vulgare subsp. vulgare]|uniref:uncharacterized protein LOC123424842 isoform X2 n=1 Tax=Hordeum vulgare subsp. vulgare TaxID=112509 RepID=UPI001D1A4032|nr:uncharacterized protein LOC123424842 isoform X2 [Hordeum vulgare subsp. vulgare]XP_044964519.1 uncharacterized protein LOC123424876 isoform X2 [Hordeum vulgare subsp. vulgare]